MTTFYVVACSGPKLDHAAPAGELYQGSATLHALAAARQLAAQDGGQVLILSALHGLVQLDQVVEPYNVTMTDAESITAGNLAYIAASCGISYGDEVYALLPRVYFQRLNDALQLLDVYPQDVYEGCAGIGYQRQVNRLVTVPASCCSCDDRWQPCSCGCHS